MFYLCTMQSMTIKVKNLSDNPLPAYSTIGSSGMDVHAFMEQSVLLHPMERVLLPTGLYVELPHGYEIQVRPRSGLAINKGITCLNTPGTIDADYRGEIKVILINLSADAQVINPGDRIAQLVLQRVEQINWLPADELNKTNRSDGGFGHSGV